MTTYIAMGVSASMFPQGGLVRCSALTPELVRARLEKVGAASLLSDRAIKTIGQRLGVAVPPSTLALDDCTLSPGDELFVVLPASMSFVRWRVPVRVGVRAPSMIPQAIFDEIIDHAHAIALWQRGEDHLKSVDDLLGDLEGEIEELKAAELPVDAWLESSDILYKCCCVYYADKANSEFILDDEGGAIGDDARAAMFDVGINVLDDLPVIIDVALAKYARRANGEVFDLAVERELARPLIRRH